MLIFAFHFQCKKHDNLLVNKNLNSSWITFQLPPPPSCPRAPVPPVPLCRAESDPLGDHLGQHLTRPWIYQTNLSVLNELHLVWLWRLDYMCSLESTHSDETHEQCIQYLVRCVWGEDSHLGCQMISTDILASAKPRFNETEDGFIYVDNRT